MTRTLSAFLQKLEAYLLDYVSEIFVGWLNAELVWGIAVMIE